MEEDLFSSSTLYVSFEDKKPVAKKAQLVDKKKSTDCTVLNDSVEVVNLEEGEREGKSPEVADFSSGLIVLDETGSEGSSDEVEEGKKMSTDSDVGIISDSGSTVNLNGSSDNENAETVAEKKPDVVIVEAGTSKNAVVKTVVNSDKRCECATCPHLETIQKLKRENEKLRRQIKEIEVRHKVSLERVIKKSCCSCSNTKVESKSESYSGFCIDKGGVEPQSSKGESWQVPSYNTSYSEALKLASEEEEESAISQRSTKSSCWNCLGDHMLTECPEKRDQQKIAKNRQEFMSRTGGKQARYHAEDDLRFARFRPGRICCDLRQALGLNRKDLPQYIYKMRRLGYPPGWLKEAEVTSSGISVYDSEEKVVAASSSGDKEDGEVTEVASSSVEYDPKLLVAYPGFNSQITHGYRDDWQRLGFPPMQKRHLKFYSELRHGFGDSRRKRKKRKRSSSSDKHGDAKRMKTTRDEVDMDIDDDAKSGDENGLQGSDSFVEPLPPGVGVCPNGGTDLPTECPSSDSNVDSIPTKATPPSPSLELLESAKERLETALGDDKGHTTENASERQTPDSATGNRIRNGESKGFSASKFVQLGSPSIFRASKGMQLPMPEKFALGISEHIPFENLPDSVGKYTTMKKILKKVRQVMSDL